MSELRVTAILVGYDEPLGTLTRALDSLKEQSARPAQIIYVDQSDDARYERFLARERYAVEVLAVRENLGYAIACNRAGEHADGDFLLFLNPDSIAEPRCVDELLAAFASDDGIAIAGAQVLLPERLRVNAGDNPVHLSGIAWSGRYGAPPEDGPSRDAPSVSGAALMVRRSAWDALGGCTEGFFMYYDDVDLAWRARMLGWRVVFQPSARTVHDYEFSKGASKWRYLERNRWWCVLAHYETRTLVLLAPLLIAVEAVIWLYAARARWLPAKRESWLELWRGRTALRSRRRALQASRMVGDRDVLLHMSATIESPMLPRSVAKLAAPILRAYRHGLLRLYR